MKTFENFKEYIVNQSTVFDACSEQLNKAKNASNFSELFDIIKHNIKWCIKL